MSTDTVHVDRLNRIFISALVKLSRANPEEWYKNVEKFQRFLNNSYQRNIGRSPLELFDTKMRCPEEFRLCEIIEEEIASVYEADRNENNIVKVNFISSYIICQENI